MACLAQERSLSLPYGHLDPSAPLGLPNVCVCVCVFFFFLSLSSVWPHLPQTGIFSASLHVQAATDPVSTDADRAVVVASPLLLELALLSLRMLALRARLDMR